VSAAEGSRAVVHHAPLVLPVAGPPIPDGGVVVADGRIVAVGALDALRAAHPSASTRAWRGVLTPGLVNAHTHLQYTSFGAVGTRRHPTYLDWSDAFVAEYARRSGGDWAAAARRGVGLSLRAGVTCLGDVVTDLAARDVLADEGVAGVTYLEILGADEAVWQRGGEAAVREAIASARVDGWVRVGLSPHTPYTVDEPVLRASAALARELGVRLHVHLGEVDSEAEFYRTATGPLAERMARVSSPEWFVLARGGTGLSAAGFADACGLLGPDTHVAHGVHLDRDDVRLLRARGVAVALCPRSNAVTGTGEPPVAMMLAEGIDLAVGTDSLASSPSLDLLEDVAVLRALALAQGRVVVDLDERLLAAATIGGARALGLDGELGTLEPGKRADLAVFAVEVSGGATAVVEHGAGRCVGTVAGGRVRWEMTESGGHQPY
jgi:aminodeoxyfutalosine deaminase